MYKQCISCKSEKVITSFVKSSKNKTGYINVCKDCYRDYKHKWRTTKKEHIREYRALYNYSLSKEEFKNLDKKCFSCGSEEKLAIDHCHDSGKVRGVLCSACNLALGLVKDNINTLSNLIKYIQNPPNWIKDKE